MSNKRTSLLTLVVLLSTLSVSTAMDRNADQDHSLVAYYDARGILNSGRVHEAALRFESLLKAYPDSPVADDAAFYLGYCWEKLDQMERAFKQYREFLGNENFTHSPRRHIVLSRAIDLAIELRQVRGDAYDEFLTTNYVSEISARYRLESAIRMAQVGNWQGVDLLIEGLETGDDIQKVRIIELLRFKMQEEKVRQAMERALENSSNEIVRMTAASALTRFAGIDSVRDTMRKAALHDRNRLVRVNAVHALARHISEEEVKQTFELLIRSERDPVVLRGAITAVSEENGEIKIYLKNNLIKRLEVETDPTIAMTIVDGIRHHVVLEEDPMVVAQPLFNNPVPVVRIGAIDLLANRIGNPEARYMIVRTLRNDPDVKVKIYAINALSKQTTHAEVRDVLLETASSAKDIELRSYSVKALSNLVDSEEVRANFLTLLKEHQNEYLAVDLINALAAKAEEYPEIQDAFLQLWRSSDNAKLKAYSAKKLKKLTGEERIATLADLYREEQNPYILKAYYLLLARTDPQKAEEIKKEKEQ